jgi:hypothetical protein
VRLFLIRSTEETMLDGSPAWWNHERSEWGHVEYATIVPEPDKDTAYLPINGELVEFTEAA